MTEKHQVELKRQLNSGPKDNTELARDIASFAVDGGLLFIGVDEHKETPGPPPIFPIPLDVRERIEQVARSRIDPPLSVGNEAQTLTRRADGWAIHSHSMGSDGSVPDKSVEYDLLDFEITEDGEVRMYCGRGTDASGRDQAKVCDERVTGGLAKRLVLIALELSTQCGFEGTWDFDFSISGLRGAVSGTLRMNLMAHPIPYSADTYRESTAATTVEMRDHVDDVVLRLVGRRNRALNDGKLGVP